MFIQIKCKFDNILLHKNLMTQKLGTNFRTEKWNIKWHKKRAQNTKWYRTVTVVEAPDHKII